MLYLYNFTRLIFIKAACFLFLLSFSIQAIEFTNKPLNLYSAMKIAEDKNKSATVDTLAQLNWQNTQSSFFNKGYSDSAYWLEVSVSISQQKDDLIIFVDQPMLDYVDVWIKDESGNILDSWKTGDRLPYSSRAILSRNFVFPLILNNHQLTSNKVTLIFRLDSYDGYFDITQFYLLTKEDFHHINEKDILIYGVFYGSIIALFFYNILLWLSNRDNHFIRYACYLFFLFIIVFTYRGYAGLYFWPNSPIINNQINPLSICLALLSAYWFSSKLLNLSAHFSTSLTLFRYILFSLPIPIVLAFIGYYSLTFYFITMSVVLYLIGLFYFAISLSLKGDRTAQLFVLAWGLLSFGVIVYFLSYAGLFPYSFWVERSMDVGIWLETLLLAFILANKLNRLEKNKIDAEREAFESKKKLNSELELLVDERTLELNLSEKKYREMYQVAQKEKERTELALNVERAAIKQNLNFIDMISHEYRTPLSVLNIGLDILEEKVSADCIHMLSRMRASVDRLLHLFEISLDEKRIKDANVVLVKQPINVINLLATVVEYIKLTYPEHIIVIENNSVGDIIIEVDKELLNIVLLNLLDNACKYSEAKQVITVFLNTDDNKLSIDIQDYGVGIEAKEIPMIFEKYYRSEKVGKQRGVGVGLFLVKQVVDLHKGSISVASILGEGTTIRVYLPQKESIKKK